MTGENSDPNHDGADKQHSWATGTTPELNSIYQRLIAVRPETEGHFANTARGGAKAIELAGQARTALNQVPRPALVIIQTIDNDIRCDGTDNAHIAEFGTAVADALHVITQASPNSRILVVSQLSRPAGYAAVVARNPSAKASQTGSGMCDLFNSAGALDQGHVARLTAIIDSYEAEQFRVCATVPQCSGDDGAFAHYVDDINDFVQGDWNHLNVHGLTRVADTLWPTVAKLLNLS